MSDVNEILGLMLVRNDDRFVSTALRNLLDFVDRVQVLDHQSTDATREKVEKLAKEFPEKIKLRQIEDLRESHAFLEPEFGRRVWLFAVDGDEIYDPRGLAELREPLRRGEYDAYWRLYGHVLNVKRWDRKKGMAHGYFSPPARPMTKLFNLHWVESWTGCPQRLHGGELRLKDGREPLKAIRAFFHEMPWEESPFRCLHMVFLNRTSARRSGLFRECPADEIHKSLLCKNALQRLKFFVYQNWRVVTRRSGKQRAYRKGPVVRRSTEPFFQLETPEW